MSTTMLPGGDQAPSNQRRERASLLDGAPTSRKRLFIVARIRYKNAPRSFENNFLTSSAVCSKVRLEDHVALETHNARTSRIEDIILDERLFVRRVRAR